MPHCGSGSWLGTKLHSHACLPTGLANHTNHRTTSEEKQGVPLVTEVPWPHRQAWAKAKKLHAIWCNNVGCWCLLWATLQQLLKECSVEMTCCCSKKHSLKSS